MDYEIIWTRQAEIRFQEISQYLLDRWSQSEQINFIEKLEENLGSISNHPYSNRASSTSLNREAIITKHNLLIYRVEKNKIVLLTIWDTRMNPKKKQY